MGLSSQFSVQSVFPASQTIISRYIIHEIRLQEPDAKRIYLTTSCLCTWALQMHSPCMSCEVINMESIFCPPLTSLAKQNWLPPQHRGHNLSADVLQLWAEQSVRGGDGGAARRLEYSPQMYEVMHVGTQANTYISKGRRPSPQTDEAAKQPKEWRARWRSRPGSCALQTRFSNHTLSKQTEGMFLHETAISTVKSLSLVQIQLLEPEDAASHQVSFHGTIKLKAFFSVCFFYLHIYINLYKYKMSFTRQTELCTDTQPL